MTVKKRVGITGASGRIGTILTGALYSGYALTLIDIREPDKKLPATCHFVKADLSKEDSVRGLFSGLDAIIHLAADPNPRAGWDSVLHNNIIATYNVFEEARRAGVKKIVFASTNHVQRGHFMAGTSLLADDLSLIRRNGPVKISDPPSPDSLYAVSKLFGEDLGRYYARLFDIRFVALRIGSVSPKHIPEISTPDAKYVRDHFLAMFIGKKDLAAIFEKALHARKKYIVAYAVSDNRHPIFDLTSTRTDLHFHPVERAEDFYKGKI